MTTATAPLAFPVEQGGPRQAKRESYDELLQRLSALSVRKCYDPYKDIDWEAKEHALVAGDPRLCIDPSHPLTQTAWYQGLDDDTRSRFGMQWTAQTLKYGIGLEAVLSRGLLEFCQTVPNGSAEFRYAMHEVVEEGRHSMMFQECITRSGCDPRPMGYVQSRIDDRVAHLGRTQPVMFFFAVLAGELFIDDENRRLLKRPSATVHPLLRLITQIHVTEEARHVCFAESYLREHMPKLGPVARARVAWFVPLTMADCARTMLVPDARIVKDFGIPKAALRQAFGRGSAYRDDLARITRPVRELLHAHGLLEPRHLWWWRTVGAA